MAKTQQDNIFGPKQVTPEGTLFFYDVDSPNTKEKHPNNQYPSDKFEATLGFPKEEDLEALKEACVKVGKEAFPDLEASDLDFPFADGDEKSLDSMHGNIVIKAKCKKKPKCVDGNKRDLTESDIDAGMSARMAITPMSYKSGRNKGVTFILKALQVNTQKPYTSLSGDSDPTGGFGDDWASHDAETKAMRGEATSTKKEDSDDFDL